MNELSQLRPLVEGAKEKRKIPGRPFSVFRERRPSDQIHMYFLMHPVIDCAADVRRHL
jgi:hypothetical protein